MMIFVFYGIVFSGCQNQNLSTLDHPIKYLSNDHVHFHSIPRPCKRVEIHTNGSVAIRKVAVIYPSGSEKPLEGELATYFFTPDTPGVYTLRYEYAYTNHFEHLFPENPDAIDWENAEYTFHVRNYPIPADYESVVSTNQHITLHYPKTTDSHQVNLILEVKPFQVPTKMEITINNYAIFPEAYTFTGSDTVCILFPQDWQYCKDGIQFIQFDPQNQEEKKDTLTFQKDIPIKTAKSQPLLLNDQKPAEYIEHSVFFLEEGALKVWNFKVNQLTTLANDQDYRHFALSPNQKQIALSTLNDTYICDYNGMNIKKIAPGYHKPIFVNDSTLLLVGAYQWPEGTLATYGKVQIQNNVYRMPLAFYSLSIQTYLAEIQVDVFLGDRWSMYYPTFESIPVDIVPFEKSSGVYLLKINSPGLEPKWLSVNQTTVQEYTNVDTPWIAQKPVISREFWYQGDIQEAILRKTTHSNQDDVLYVEKDYATLSLPEAKGRFLTFVRTVQDIVSAPSFYVEKYQELCVYDNVTKHTYTLPTRAVTVTHLGG
jgi:hypothetical protein